MNNKNLSILKNLTSKTGHILQRSLLCLSLIGLTSFVHAAYTPATGSIVLTDTIGGVTGAITSTMMGNAELQKERACIQKFIATQSPTTPHTYQAIMDRIQTAQTDQALQALQAYANIVMYIYHDKAYWLKTNNKPSFFFKGLRSSWISFSWLNPMSYLWDNDEELEQLIREYDQLANIALRKKPLIGKQMKCLVNVYRYWRIYAIATIGSYMIYDIRNRDRSQTILQAICNRSPKEIIKTSFKNIKTDIGNLVSSPRGKKDTPHKNKPNDTQPTASALNQVLNNPELLKVAPEKAPETPWTYFVNYWQDKPQQATPESMHKQACYAMIAQIKQHQQIAQQHQQIAQEFIQKTEPLAQAVLLDAQAKSCQEQAAHCYQAFTDSIKKTN